MFSAAKRHTMKRLAAASIRTAPFPHIFVDEIFPPEFYAEMQRRKLSDDSYTRLVDTGRVGLNYSPARLCFMPGPTQNTSADADNIEFWNEFVVAYNDESFLQTWLQVFKAQIQERVKADHDRFSVVDGQIGVQSEMFLMRDKETYALNPHMDSPPKAIAALFYLPADDRNLDLGTSIYTQKNKDLLIEGGVHIERENFDLMATIPYRANTLFAFPNLPGSFHGVEPVAGQSQSRDVMLYDVKFTTMKPRDAGRELPM